MWETLVTHGWGNLALTLQAFAWGSFGALFSTLPVTRKMLSYNETE